MALLNPREEIISLLRGYIACPIMSCLGRHNILEKMLQSEFTMDDFPTVGDKSIFQAILRYFVDIGLLESDSNGIDSVYNPTELGNKVFRRYGSFCLVHSYSEYIESLENLLFNPYTQDLPEVNRLENVIGSGQTNSRKFFPAALEMLEGTQLRAIVDIGCGDGKFLGSVLEMFPDASVAAVDISEIALRVTVKNLNAQFPKAKVISILSDGIDVTGWSTALKKQLPEGVDVVSMWYLIHEISKGSVDTVTDFLKAIHQYCPGAEIIIGEIIAVPSNLLAIKRHESIMPEFLFFHTASGQNVLTWEQYQECLLHIPFELANQSLFDIVEGTDGTNVPSAFVWHLKPK